MALSHSAYMRNKTEGLHGCEQVLAGLKVLARMVSGWVKLEGLCQVPVFPMYFTVSAQCCQYGNHL